MLTPVKSSKALEQVIHEVPESVVNGEIVEEDHHDITDQAVLEILLMDHTFLNKLTLKETNKLVVNSL